MRTFFLTTILSLTVCSAQAQDPAATLALYTGDCFVWRRDSSVTAEIGLPLYVGDSLRTGKDSKAELSFPDGSAMRISENARLLVQRADTVRSFGLLWGKLWAKVAKLASSRTQFQVETPTAVAGVRGTVFRVEVQADSSTRVAVEEGEVEVYHPRLVRRRVRLAALREALVRRNQDPTDPMAFDPAKERRWERWTRKGFSAVEGLFKATAKGLERRLGQHEKLLETARRLQTSWPKLGADGPRRLGDLRRKAFDNQRQWRLLLNRCERRLHQLQVLSRRAEDAEPGALKPLAEDAGARLEKLAGRFQEIDSRISEILEALEAGESGYPGPSEGSEAVYARLAKLKASAQLSRALLEKAGPELEQVADRLADFTRQLAVIRQLLPDRPLLARELFLKLRTEYFAFKQQYRGFDYSPLEKAFSEQRPMAAEAERVKKSISPGDPKMNEADEIKGIIKENGVKWKGIVSLVRKIYLNYRLIERQLVELSNLVK